MDKKTDLRTKMKELRKTLDMQNISKELVRLLKQNDYYKHSRNVMLFYPTKYEVDLTQILSDDKNFYLPRVNDKELEVCCYKLGDKLKKSKLGILEPVGEPTSLEILELVIVPALSADKNGYRLGYGGGYYDRFLKNYRGKTLCAIPKELKIEHLPHDEFDIPVDTIISI